jgi:hypothetical protein
MAGQLALWVLACATGSDNATLASYASLSCLQMPQSLHHLTSSDPGMCFAQRSDTSAGATPHSSRRCRPRQPAAQHRTTQTGAWPAAVLAAAAATATAEAHQVVSWQHPVQCRQLASFAVVGYWPVKVLAAHLSGSTGRRCQWGCSTRRGSCKGNGSPGPGRRPFQSRLQ